MHPLSLILDPYLVKLANNSAYGSCGPEHQVYAWLYANLVTRSVQSDGTVQVLPSSCHHLLIAVAVQDGKLSLPFLNRVDTAAMLRNLEPLVDLHQLTLRGCSGKRIPVVPTSLTALTSLSLYLGLVDRQGLFCPNGASSPALKVR